MLNQEILYQQIYNQQWNEILDAFHKHKKEFADDVLLSRTGKIFEEAFFKKLVESQDKNLFIDQLNSLYLLHHGNFYKLSDDNYKLLILELVQQSPFSEAVNYAGYFPDDPICKAIIKRAETLRLKELQAAEQNRKPSNWTEIFNRLFELINNPQDVATYFSGPKFINVVREAETYFPDYTQYIDQRTKDGKSTTRKIFFYDILTDLNEASRNSVLIRLFDLIRPFRQPQVEQIELLLGFRSSKEAIDMPDEIIVPINMKENPKVFISYSWDNEAHKSWVLNLSNRLRSNGVDVILDRYYLKAGKSITHFVEDALKTADKVIIIFTPNYKLKADQRKGGVGYEYSIVNNALYKNQTGNEKIIPVLRTGTMNEGIPDFMQQYIHMDMSNDSTFETSYTDLLREIYNEPAIAMPEIGKRPTF